MELHVLLVGQGPDTGMLSDFMLRRSCRVENCPDGGRVMSYVQHRAEAGTPYHIILIEVDSAGVDSLALTQQIHQFDGDCNICLMVDFTQVEAYIGPADQAGASRVFDKPVDLSKLERFLQDQDHLRAAGIGTNPHMTQAERLSKSGKHVLPPTDSYQPSTAHHRRSTGNYRRQQSESSTTPFFGTDRLTGSDRHEQSGQQSGEQPTTGYRRKSSVDNIIDSQRPTTSRVRRSVTGKVVKEEVPVQPTFPEDGPIDVSQLAGQAGNGAVKRVACAHCHQVMTVMVKSEPYTMPCIHCGQLNRIMA